MGGDGFLPWAYYKIFHERQSTYGMYNLKEVYNE